MKKIMYLIAAALLLCAAMTSIRAQAPATTMAAPATISYQGILGDQNGAAVKDGNYTLHLSLYSDPDGQSAAWQGTYTVNVSNGIFNVAIGSGDYPLPAAAKLDGPLYLGTRIGEGAEMRPLSPVAASLVAVNVSDGAITAKKMGTDYVQSLSLNGQKISARGVDINIQTGNGIDALLDPTTNTLYLKGSGTSSTPDTKGGSVQSINVTMAAATGTTNAIPKYTGSSIVNNSSLTDDGTTFKVGSYHSVTESNGNTSIGGTLGVSGATSLSSLSTSGNASIGGTLGVTGATTLGGNLTINGTSVTYANNSTINYGNGSTAISAGNVSAAGNWSWSGAMKYPGMGGTNNAGILLVNTGGTANTLAGGPTWNGTALVGNITGTASGAPPTGAAGGDLTGTYPNPTIGAGKVTNTDLAHSSLTINTTAPITGGGPVSLGGSLTLAMAANAYDAYGAAATAQSNAETFATNAANTAQSNAETFATNAANTAQSNAETFATAGDATTLSTAEGYTDTQIAAAEATDATDDANAIATALSTAEAYSDVGDATTLSTAESYTNTQIAAAEATDATDDAAAIAAAVTTVEGYTDTQIAAAEAADETADASAISAAVTAAETADNTYTNNAITAAEAADATADASAISAAVTAAETADNAYTDNAITVAEAADATADASAISSAITALNLSQYETIANDAADAQAAISVTGGSLTYNSGVIGLDLNGYSTTTQMNTAISNAIAAEEASDFALPSQSGNAGKVLTTDGTTASWQADNDGGGGGGGGGTYASLQAQPSNPASVAASSGPFMMGIGGTASITPSASGKLMIIISGMVGQSTNNGSGSTVRMYYGTGTAPSNGNAVSGTAAGSALTTSGTYPFTLNQVVTGLTTGTTYWIDLGLTNNGSGTSNVSMLSVSVVELP